MQNNFILLRYFIRSPLNPGMVRSWYELYHGPDYYHNHHMAPDPRNRVLTSAQARELIQDYGMVKVTDNEHGEVWEQGESTQEVTA